MEDGSFSCILFVNTENSCKVIRSTQQSSSKGYALLFPSRFAVTKNSFVIKLFSENCLEVVQEKEVTPSNVDDFEAIEIKLKSICHFYENPRSDVYVSCCDSNVALVRQLFGKSERVQVSTHNFIPNLVKNLTRLDLTYRDVNLIRKLLAANPNMPFRDLEGGTLLHFAAERGYDALFDTLLELGADVNKRKTSNSSTVLHSVINSNYHLEESFVQTLLDRGADVNAVDSLGATPLHKAAGVGDEIKPIISLFLKHGANLNALDSEGVTPLLHSYAHPKMLRFLFESGAEINVETTKGQTVLLKAMEQKCFKSVKYILNFKPDTNIRGNRSAFYIALGREEDVYAKLTRKMLRRGFTVSSDATEKPNIIFGAIDKGYLEIVHNLLDSNVAVNQWHTFMGLTLTPLHLAVRRNREDIVRLLLKHNADVTAESAWCETPLVFAVKYGSVTILKLLFKATAAARLNHALLFVAVSHARFENMKYLLDQGLDPNFTDESGKTCLSFISVGCTLEILGKLATYGFQFQYTDVNHVRFTQWFLDRCPIDGSASNLPLLNEVTGRHLIKIGTLVPEIDARSLIGQLEFNRYNLSVFQKECEVESKKLDERIGNSNARYRDILTSGVQRVAYLARNPNIVDEMEMKVVQVRFPIYSNLLVCKFKIGVQRKKLVDRANPVMKAIFSKFTASEPLGRPVVANDVSELILGFLSNRDLIVLRRYLSAK